MQVGGVQAISTKQHLEVWSSQLVIHNRKCAAVCRDLGEFSSLGAGEQEGPGREAGVLGGYQKWNQEERPKGKQIEVLALNVGSWPWIAFLDQTKGLGEGVGGNEWHKVMGE